MENTKRCVWILKPTVFMVIVMYVFLAVWIRHRGYVTLSFCMMYVLIWQTYEIVKTNQLNSIKRLGRLIIYPLCYLAIYNILKWLLNMHI